MLLHRQRPEKEKSIDPFSPRRQAENKPMGKKTGQDLPYGTSVERQRQGDHEEIEWPDAQATPHVELSKAFPPALIGGRIAVMKEHGRNKIPAEDEEESHSGMGEGESFPQRR